MTKTKRLTLKEYLKRASKTRHATLKFLPDEFWGIEEKQK